jgi:hypothetical protein
VRGNNYGMGASMYNGPIQVRDWQFKQLQRGQVTIWSFLEGNVSCYAS